MKKLLLLGVVSLTTVSLAAGQASAWFWDDWFCHCKTHCTINLTYRPYNAFDPGCPTCGFGGMPGWGWVPPPYPPPYMNNPGSSCFNSGCCDAGCLPDSDPMGAPSAPARPAPTTPTPAPQFTPPMPTPVPSTSQMFYSPMQVAPNGFGPAGNNNPGYYMNMNMNMAGGQYPMQGYAPYGMYGYGMPYGR